MRPRRQASRKFFFCSLLAVLRPNWHSDANLLRGNFRTSSPPTARSAPAIANSTANSSTPRCVSSRGSSRSSIPIRRARRRLPRGWPPSCPRQKCFAPRSAGTGRRVRRPSRRKRRRARRGRQRAVARRGSAAHCPEAAVVPNLDALHTRASLWLRLQTPDFERVFAEFKSLGWAWRRAAVLPTAVELLTEADVTKTAAWTAGLFEVQDLGSQLNPRWCRLAPGGHWLDACAGAGGKTLQLASLLGPIGRVDAHDIRPSALKERSIRATRAVHRPTSQSSPPHQRRRL